jgi:hypothetical protein
MKKLLLLALLIAAPVSAQPGITNGYLTDPHAYVGSLIDFGHAVPVDALPGELARIRPMLNACNIHLQNEARGDYRARLFLPPSEFDHAVDIYDFGGSQTWVWVDRGGPFQPARCAFAQPEPTPIPVPPPVVTPPPLVIDTAGIIAAIDRNTAELASIHRDVNLTVGQVFGFIGKYIAPAVAASIATWQVAK